ncbi:MAG: NUDIX domain-containing protein [Acidimicrobiales bacterium]
MRSGGELPEDGARRELVEETGLDVDCRVRRA